MSSCGAYLVGRGERPAVGNAELGSWVQIGGVAGDVEGEVPALVVVPAELPEVLVRWKRWPVGLEFNTFVQVALGVQRSIFGSGSLGDVGFPALVVGQVVAGPGVEGYCVVGVGEGAGQRVQAGDVTLFAFPDARGSSGLSGGVSPVALLIRPRGRTPAGSTALARGLRRGPARPAPGRRSAGHRDRTGTFLVLLYFPPFGAVPAADGTEAALALAGRLPERCPGSDSSNQPCGDFLEAVVN